MRSAGLDPTAVLRSVGGGAAASWSLANLAPRAIKTHRWYREQFAEYPRERKALLPFIL